MPAMPPKFSDVAMISASAASSSATPASAACSEDDIDAVDRLRAIPRGLRHLEGGAELRVIDDQQALHRRGS